MWGKGGEKRRRDEGNRREGVEGRKRLSNQKTTMIFHFKFRYRNLRPPPRLRVHLQDEMVGSLSRTKDEVHHAVNAQLTDLAHRLWERADSRTTFVSFSHYNVHFPLP